MIKRLIDILLHDEKPLRRIAARIIARSRLGYWLGLKIKVGNYLLLFHPTSLSTILWYDSTSRSEDAEFIQSFLQAGDTYIDVGANIGVTAIPGAMAVGNSGKVIAFEPHPRTVNYLRENILLNNLNNIEVQNCALGDVRGTTYFTDKSSDDMNKVVSTDKSNIQVPISLLDSFTEQYDRISLLKVDAEGYEKFVLAGAAQSMAKVECIYFEVDECNFSDFGYSSQDLLRQVMALGFSIWRRNGQKQELVPIEVNSFAPLTTGYENLFGVRDIHDFSARTKWHVSSSNTR
jgi:FkbM family methyltransferase